MIGGGDDENDCRHFGGGDDENDCRVNSVGCPDTCCDGDALSVGVIWVKTVSSASSTAQVRIETGNLER
ncbi:hypothetical protein BC826DRAFT_1088667 [Russula brevipes]|nr:hypothetical protein BC826DRAFT_1088667 [Russula brevipes]